MTFQEDGLFQSTEELVVGDGIFDSAKIELRAGADDELRLVGILDGDGQSQKIATVIEGSQAQ